MNETCGAAGACVVPQVGAERTWRQEEKAIFNGQHPPQGPDTEGASSTPRAPLVMALVSMYVCCPWEKYCRGAPAVVAHRRILSHIASRTPPVDYPWYLVACAHLLADTYTFAQASKLQPSESQERHVHHHHRWPRQNPSIQVHPQLLILKLPHPLSLPRRTRWPHN